MRRRKRGSAIHASARASRPADSPPPYRKGWRGRKFQNPAAFVFRKEVGNKGGRNGYKRCLANAYQSVTQQQLSVGVGDRRHQSQPAPEHSPQYDDQLARVPVSERTHKRRGHHVEQEKSAGKISNLGVGELEFGLYQRLHREQY